MNAKKRGKKKRPIDDMLAKASTEKQVEEQVLKTNEPTINKGDIYD